MKKIHAIIVTKSLNEHAVICRTCNKIIKSEIVLDWIAVHYANNHNLWHEERDS